MSDIALILKDNCFDINVLDGDLESDEGLESAVAISLFTDKRVTDEQLPYGKKDKKGWWGDMVPEVEQDQIGSRLWTIDPSKTTTDTLRLSEDYCREALNWLIEDGLSNEINIISDYNDNRHLIIDIEIIKPDNTSIKFQANWDAQDLRRA